MSKAGAQARALNPNWKGGRSSARGTVGGLCGECGGECGGEGVILGGDDGHGNQEEWPCRSCTRVPLPKGG